MDVPTTIQTILRETGLKQALLAKALGVAQGTISKWLSRQQAPNKKQWDEVLAFIARTESIRYLIEGQDNPAGEQLGGYRPAPEFLGDRDLRVFAAAEGGPGEMVVNTDPIEMVPRPWYMREVRDGFAVLVVGDSMVPVFDHGDIAVVNPRLPYTRGKDVILIRDDNQHGEFTASIKRLVHWTEAEWHLQQFNPPAGQKSDLRWSRALWPKALRVVGKFYGS